MRFYRLKKRPPAVDELRIVFSLVAQQLRHGGFTNEEICAHGFIPNRTPADVEALFLEGEKRRPKLCLEECSQFPACPFCADRFEMVRQAQESYTGPKA